MKLLRNVCFILMFIFSRHIFQNIQVNYLLKVNTKMGNNTVTENHWMELFVVTFILL